jgi:signal transduction histidine kinase
MDHNFKPVTRLSIVFILAIVLSGSVLTYFSINNISNLKELTEKRVIEEQRILHAQFSAALHDRLDAMTGGLVPGEPEPGAQKDLLSRRAEEFDCIIQPFITEKEGQFVYPLFEGIPDRVLMPESTEEFILAFAAGEKAEFTAKDPGIAESYYMSCLKYSNGSNDSVRALNALGRIALKRGDRGHAVARYSLIVTGFYSESDENGYPYIYYALPQLLKITSENNSEEVAGLIGFSLEKMQSGSVPLNYSTGELLGLIKDWSESNMATSSGNRAELNDLMEILDRQLRFVNVYGDELKGINEGNLADYYATDGGFKIVTSRSGENHEFFLVNTDFDSPAGFLVDRDMLFDTLVKQNLRDHLDFDYLMEFPEGYNLYENNQTLVYSAQLDPIFPGQLVRISLADEDLINRIVRSRSWIYGIASILLLAAMVLGVALILRDIAREKHMARLRADFISNVTHELKTPLTSIRMYAESMIMGRVRSEERRREYLEVVVHESDRLKGMINNILEFSKMEKGSPEYHFVTTDLALLIREAISEMSHWFSQEGFEITSELDSNLHADVDPEKMKQALNNLFSNAIKYSPDNKQVYIRLFRKEDNVIIEVEDHGIGIPDDKLSKIFEPFYRIGQEEGASGTGLGLTVVKEIVEAHGGMITVASKTGEGSKFVITLNQQPAENENNTGDRR